MIRCINCGNWIEEDSDFCYFCGFNPNEVASEEEMGVNADDADGMEQFTGPRMTDEEISHELERRQAVLEKRQAMSQMLITSGFNFEGYRIVKYSGYISGDDAISVDRGYAFFDNVGVKDKLMDSLTVIRRNALKELKEAAYNLGCNAVIGVDFDYLTLDPQTANLTGGTVYQPYVFGVTANGNAVVIEKIENE